MSASVKATKAECCRLGRQAGNIGWYGRLQPLLTEPYGSRAELLQLLDAQFGLDEDAVASGPYTVDKPDEGYVIGFQVKQ